MSPTYHVWTVAMLKGGVRKTTTAFFLASALAKIGHHPLGVDADPGTQGMTDWTTRIYGGGMTPAFDVAQWTARYGLLVPFIAHHVGQNGNTHVLVDVGGETPEVARQAAVWSSLAILPVGPEQAELARLEETSRLMKDAGVLVPQVVLLTRVPQVGKGTARRVRELLTEEGYLVAQTEIPHNRDIYAGQFGYPVSDLGAYEALADELADMAKVRR